MKNFLKIFTAFLFTVLFACSPEQPADLILNQLRDAGSGYVMVAAHRASHKNYVENSLPAIRHAIEIGVDIIEVDVKVTKDSVVVLNHDGKIDRTTNGIGNPEEYTWAELQQFRLEMPDSTLTKEHLATFEEALLLAKGKVLIDIDIKTGNLKPVVDVIKKTGTQNQVFFFDNDYIALKEVRKMLPGVQVMPRAYSVAMADSALKLFSPEVVHIDESFYTPELNKLLSEKDARMWINALGEPDDLINAGKGIVAIDSLLMYGANIIQTDEPEKIISILKEKGLRKL